MESSRPRLSNPGRGREGLLSWIRLLADEVGPRRPTTAAEREAAERMRDRLREAGVDADLEPFRGLSTFAAPFGAINALALAPALLPSRWRLTRGLLAACAGAGLAAEGGLKRTPISDALAGGDSQNLVAAIEPSGEACRTVCLVCHLDTSRSGLLFDPRFARHLQAWLSLQSLAVAVQAGELLLSRRRAGRAVLAASRALLAAGAALLAERELRGVDVPGANDNASGVALVAELATELAASPLESTRVVALMCGCEESGLQGVLSFLRSRDTAGWLFVNVDTVGAGVLHYLPREGIVQKWDADQGLCAVAASVAAEHPELGLRRADVPIGLTYDATPVMAAGGRAITLVAAHEDGTIPNYHQPSDTTANLDVAVVERAHSAARELVAAIDRGEAD
jgi:hypothetical protein